MKIEQKPRNRRFSSLSSGDYCHPLPEAKTHDLAHMFQIICSIADQVRTNLDLCGADSEGLSAIIGAARFGGALLHSKRESEEADQVSDLSSLTRQIWRQFIFSSPETVAISYNGTNDPIFVRAAPADLYRLILNLLTNAIEATAKNGGGEVRIILKHQVGRRIKLCIEDSGGGVEPKKELKIFEQGKSTRGNGRGIGLGVVRSIVNKTGGNLSLVNRPGVGARFEIAFPLSDRPSTACGPGREAKMTAIKKIVIVEDDVITRGMLERILAERTEEILTFSTAEAAENELAGDWESASLLVTDYNLPGSNGSKLIERIIIENARTPVLLVSGWATLDLAEYRKKGVVCEMLVKPFAIEELVSTVDSLIREAEDLD